ncbi:hypothetical protein [Levilactobacillus wangkuiensis]|uniref:hypothetical protein n=1 Tax=Levilactobacillus wangkuiensis TaxID=2799566 RepID=UPI00194E7A33|nr:hypothetical protein [Levilactobacillus wangkuiensis]
MADRRMFSKKVVSSARFLRMPASTRELYFQLGINADDDGIVEAFTVMRQVGATEDDLHVLVAKKFVVVLNDDLVTYILDWRENNRLRADRKVDSIYKDLLLKVIPDVPLLTSKSRADVTPPKRTEPPQKPNGQPESTPEPSGGRPEDNQTSDDGQSTDGQRTEEVRLGKGSVVEGSVVKDSIGSGGLDGFNQFKSTREYLAAWKTDPETDPMISQLTLYRQQIGEPLLSHSIEYLIEHKVTLAGVPKYLAKTVNCWLRNGIATPEEAEKYESDRQREPEPQSSPDLPDVPIFKLTDKGEKK